MATYTLIKLKNMTPLHIGTGKENYDFSSSDLHSDTLSAALAAMKMQKQSNADTKAFMESFIISSAYPFIGNHYFLPKPQGKVNIQVTDAEEYVSRKKLKRIKYIEINLWNDLIAGKELHVQTAQIKGSFLLENLSEKDFDIPYKSQVNQRVTVPRDLDKDAEPFFFEWTYFQENAGLFCLLDVADKEKEDILDLFKQLGEVGLGTDKNIGGGKFEIEVAQLSISEVNTANAIMLLSLFIPTEKELPRLNLPNSRYELLQRGGYIAGSQDVMFRHLRKKSVYMFNIGSVFSTTIPIRGRVIDLRPDWQDKQLHPVFRSGKPFVVPIKMIEI